MKKTQKILIFLSIFLAFLAIFALNFVFFAKNEEEQSFFDAGAFVCEQSEKTKPVISSNYNNGLCEFVYNGTPYHLNVSISSGQELIFYRILGDEEVEVENAFEAIGEYKMKVTANETMTYSAPDPLYLTVRVLPRSLSSKTEGKTIKGIEIINDDGFSLENTYSATDISRSQRHAAKKAVKKELEYKEEILEIFGVEPDVDAQSYDTMSVNMELPDNFASTKNYRIFEYRANGELKELSYIINRGSFALSNVATDSLIIVTANKPYPYLWIWLLTASLSFVGMIVLIYFYAPRRLNFYLEGSKIYVVKLGRRQDFALADGLENYEWYLDKNLTIKATSFGVKETSRNFYAKIKR